MKKLYPLLLSFAFLFTKAQTDFRFADSTAQWNVITVENGLWCSCVSYYTSTYTIVKDTSISGKNYQKISNGFNVRKDSLQRVYCIRPADSVEHLLYDFSAQAGDTLYVQNSYTQQHCKVLSTDSVSIGSKFRRRLFVDYTGAWDFDTWVEGIGSLKTHPLDPALNYAFIDGESYSLLCFSENATSIYQQSSFDSCQEDTFYYVSSAKLKEEADAKVYSNQSERGGSIVVHLPKLFKAISFSVYNLTGQLLLEKELTEQTTRIDVNNLAKGVYLYEVVSGKQRLKSGKLAVD